MSIGWLDALLYELEGRATVEVDLATERLERLLARIRHVPEDERRRVVTKLVELHRQTELQHARAVARQIEADDKVHVWESRVAESKGELVEQARERLALAREAAVDVAAEVAEYAASIARLEEARTLIERTL